MDRYTDGIEDDDQLLARKIRRFEKQCGLHIYLPDNRDVDRRQLSFPFMNENTDTNDAER